MVAMARRFGERVGCWLFFPAAFRRYRFSKGCCELRAIGKAAPSVAKQPGGASCLSECLGKRSAWNCQPVPKR